MATDLAKLVVKLEAQTAKFQKDLDRANGKLERFRKKTKKNVAGISKILGGLAVGALTKSIIEATTNAEAAFKQLEQGIKSTNNAVGFSAKELAGYAQELQNATTFDDDSIVQAQAKLVTFTKIAGDEFKRTTELALDLSERFGTDLSSASVQLGKALNDPVANLSALSRAGIQFSKEQKDMIKALIDSGDQVAAQKIILGELETQFGGSARAARDTFGGALKGLGNAFGDLLESGTGLNAAKESVERLSKTLSDPKTKQAAAELTGILIDGFSTFVSILAQVPDFAKFLGESIAAAINGPADLIRIDDALIEKTKILKHEQELLNAAQLGGVQEVVDSKQPFIDQLKEEIDLLEKKKAVLQEPAAQLKPPELNVSTTPTQSNDNPSGLADSALALQEAQKAAQKIIDETAPKIDGIKAKILESVQLFSQGLLSDEQFTNANNLFNEQLAQITNADQTAFEDKIARMEENFLTETEVLQQQRDERLALLDSEIAQKVLSEEKLAKLKLKVDEKFKKDKKKLDDASSKAEIKTALTVAHGVLGILSAFAGKSFKSQKSLAIAEGIINIIGGVTKALNNPFPANLGFAATVAAQGDALMSTIKSTQLSSTGASLNVSSGAASTSFSTPEPPTAVQNSAPAEQQQQQQSISNTYVINAQGNDGEKLADEIRSYIEGGGEIIPTGSRQEEQILQGAA